MYHVITGSRAGSQIKNVHIQEEAHNTTNNTDYDSLQLSAFLQWSTPLGVLQSVLCERAPRHTGHRGADSDLQEAGEGEDVPQACYIIWGRQLLLQVRACYSITQLALSSRFTLARTEHENDLLIHSGLCKTLN